MVQRHMEQLHCPQGLCLEISQDSGENPSGTSIQAAESPAEGNGKEEHLKSNSAFSVLNTHRILNVGCSLVSAWTKGSCQLLIISFRLFSTFTTQGVGGKTITKNAGGCDLNVFT